MRLVLFFLLVTTTLQAQSYLVPYDHHLPNSRQIEIKVQFLNDFEEGRETVLILEDAFDELFMSFYERMNSTESSNFVVIKGRKNSAELKSGIIQSETPDYGLAYRLFNQDQVARDIEVVRKKLLGDSKVILLGYSSSAIVMQHYLSLFPQNVSRMITVNPLVFDIQKNLGFSDFGLSFPSLKLNQKLQFDFSYYSNFDRERDNTKNKDLNKLLLFLRFSELLPGLSNKEDNEIDFALQVRLFEHSLALLGMQNELKKPNPNFGLLKSWSSPIWDSYMKTRFPVFGTNYDELLDFQGNLILIGGAFDQLIYPKSYDILAEFYTNSTLVLLKDGHALQKTIGDRGLNALLEAFISDDFEKKIGAYSNLKKANLIFEKYNDGVFKVPPHF